MRPPHPILRPFISFLVFLIALLIGWNRPVLSADNFCLATLDPFEVDLHTYDDPARWFDNTGDLVNPSTGEIEGLPESWDSPAPVFDPWESIEATISANEPYPLLGTDPPAETGIEAQTSEDPLPGTLSGYGIWVLRDTGATLTAPLRWRTEQWIQFSLAAAIIGGTMRYTDHAADRYNRSTQQTGERQLWKQISDQNATYSFVVLGGFFVAGYGWGQDRAKRVWLEGFEASLIASTLICPVLKLAIGRHRPDDQSHALRFQPFGGTASFPSGHTTQAFAVASVLALSFPDHLWVGAGSFAIATAVGYSRLYLHKHFLSDVMAGALLGTAVGWEIVSLHRHEAEDPANRGDRTAGYLPAKIGILENADETGVEIEWLF
ncbi:MAG TPA: phosphatase PAP2 family protein [Planctomycetota bacterium]|nr:phosphatase PAP2 family protein [Planctomycetota bacterium]